MRETLNGKTREETEIIDPRVSNLRRDQRSFRSECDKLDRKSHITLVRTSARSHGHLMNAYVYSTCSLCALYMYRRRNIASWYGVFNIRTLFYKTSSETLCLYLYLAYLPTEEKVYVTYLQVTCGFLVNRMQHPRAENVSTAAAEESRPRVRIARWE